MAKCCMAPQTRKYWMDSLGRKTDEEVLKTILSAEAGLRQHKSMSQRHRHDWTIYRVCAIREARLRGLTLPS